MDRVKIRSIVLLIVVRSVEMGFVTGVKTPRTVPPIVDQTAATASATVAKSKRRVLLIVVVFAATPSAMAVKPVPIALPIAGQTAVMGCATGVRLP